MRVFVVTPPAPLVGIEEARRHLRVDGTDEDAQIEGFIAAASSHIDGPGGWLGRAIGIQELEARGPLNVYGAIQLPYQPAVDLLSVTYFDVDNAQRTVDLAAMELQGGAVVSLSANWPWAGASPRGEALRIRYQAGYEVVPAAIKAAVLLMVGDLYRNRETALMGAASAIPMSTTVDALLGPYRVFG